MNTNTSKLYSTHKAMAKHAIFCLQKIVASLAPLGATRMTNLGDKMLQQRPHKTGWVNTADILILEFYWLRYPLAMSQVQEKKLLGSYTRDIV